MRQDVRGGQRATALLLLALLSPTASADWLQDGGNAGHTGEILGGGPAWPSIALRASPPSGAWVVAPPLVIGREVLAMTGDAVYALDVDTGDLREAARFGMPVDGTALARGSDGRRLYVIGRPVGTTALALGSFLQILPLDGSAPTVVQLAGERGTLDYCAMAVADELVYVGCVAGQGTIVGGSGALAVFDAAGTLQWTWSPESDPNVLSRGSPALAGAALPFMLSVTAVDGYVTPILTGGALSANTPEVGLPEAPARYTWQGWRVNATLHSLDPRPPLPSFPDDGAIFGSGGVGPTTPHRPSALVARPGLEIRKIPRSDTELALEFWPAARSRVNATFPALDDGARVAIVGARAYAPVGSSLVALDENARVEWRVEEEGRTFGQTIALADEERVYVFEQNIGGGAYALHAFDAANGRPLWSHDLNRDVGVAFSASLVAADNGILAFLDASTADASSAELELIVMGETAASIRLDPLTPDAYPQPGDSFRIDLSRAEAGAQGPPTQYRIDWGDGETSPWQPGGAFEHSYAAAGDRTLLAYASNAAGQIAVAPVTVHVGREPPDFLAAQFSPGNQERTFFLLGLAITGLFAGAGLFRAYRRRDRLARELRELEENAQAAGADPVALDRALDEHRRRARALMLARKLDEGQHAVLLARVEELSRARRLDIVEHALDFLPHRLVKALREMLADGRVSAIERAHYLALLEADAALTPEYKAAVRRVIDQWSAHDTGSAR